MATVAVVPDETALGNAADTTSAGWALAGLALCMLLPSLGTSIANVALPTLAATLGATFPLVQWVVLAYLLANTTLIVGVGRLGDVVGRRRLLVAGIALFTSASVACALAPTLGWLIAARALQGLGAAILMALSMAFAGDVVPKERTGSAMGLLGTMSAVGTALGPSLGGVLLAGPGWRTIFLVNVPLGILALVVALRGLPADRARRVAPGRIDATGTLVLALTLAAYALAMTLGRCRVGATNAALLAAAVAGLGLFVWIEMRAASPLVSLAMFRSPTLATSLGATALVSTVMMATLVVGPFYLVRALGLGAAPAGLVMSLGPIVAAMTGVPAGRLADRLGASRLIAAGLAGVAAGCLALSLLPTTAGIAGYLAAIVTLTVGYAVFQAANTTDVLASVPSDRRGVVSGLLSLARNLGLITGASAMGAVFARAAGTNDVATAAPESIAVGMRITFAVATGVAIAAMWIARRRP